MNFDITIFEVDKNKNLVNLTKIATAFGKLVANYLKAKSTQEFLEAFKDAYPDIPNGITVIQGGSGEQGTWAHREIALDFAQWISPKFKMFCIKQLDELFQTGKVSLLKPTTAEILLQNAQAYYEHDLQIRALAKQQTALSEKVAYIEAKQTTIETDFFTVAGYCSLNGRKIATSEAAAIGMKCGKLSRENGIPIGKVHDAKYGQVNSYHKDIIQAVIDKI